MSSKVALYARVSTADRDQNPETQLMPLREWCAARGLTVYREYVDKASALDVAHRHAWRELQDDAAKHRFSTVLVWKLDRAFRSVAHLHDTLTAWKLLGIGFQATTEGWDTETAIGRLVMNTLATVAEFERDLTRERVRAGMDRARRQGKRLGRPRLVDKWGGQPKVARAIERVRVGESIRSAAKAEGLPESSLRRLLALRQNGDPSATLEKVAG